MAIRPQPERKPSNNTPASSTHNIDGTRRQRHPTTATVTSRSEQASQPLKDTSSVTRPWAERKTEHNSPPGGSYRPRGLDHLPQEGLENICRFIPTRTLSVLGQCNKFFKTFAHKTKVSELLYMEKKAINRKSSSGSSPASAGTEEEQAIFGCYICFEILEPGRFANPKNLPDRLPTDLRRFCMICGIRRGYHCPGEDIQTLTNKRV